MEIKDWILLLTPIVINGVVLYWFQLIISEKIKKSDARKELVKSIYEKYLTLTDRALKSYRETKVVLINSKNEDVINFNTIQNQLRDDVRNLQYYYQDYRCILGKEKALNDKYERLNRIFIKSNSGNVEYMIEFLKEGEMVLQDILETTLSNMLKLS